MKGFIVLGGGGNEKQSYIVEKLFFKGVKKILYIPLADKRDDFKSSEKWFRESSKKFGKFDIKVMDNPKMHVNLKYYDAVYIGGGNTFKLLKRVRNLKLFPKLLAFYRKGGRIFGGSAGAMIFGNRIDLAGYGIDSDVNAVGIKNTKGANITENYDIQCHYKDNQLKELIKYIHKYKRNIIAIPEESAVLVHGKMFKIIGKKPVTIITKESVKKFKPGKRINL